MIANINKNIIFLMGATASGKTDLAIELSKIFKTRLISVDSALIYKGMDIGTAKPSKKILRKYPHHLIDICSPEESYSAYDFVLDAKHQIELAFKNNEIPILVGGTSFYFHALEHGLSKLPESTKESKEKFNKLLKERGSVSLHKDLAKIDKKSAIRIHPNDSQRVTRALEVFDLSGKTLSDLRGRKKSAISYPIKKIILSPDRKKLHRRIEERFILMLQDDFEREVKALRQNPKLNKNLPAIRCVGYSQVWDYLDGKIDKKTMVEKAIFATRQLCKRQSTWLKKETDALVLEQIDIEKIIKFLEPLH